MANDVLKTLHAMEMELAAVKSAKEQVEDTVASSIALQSIIAKYAESLDNIKVSLNNLITDINQYKTVKNSEFESTVECIKKSCEVVNSTFSKEIFSSSNEFKKKVDDSATQFASQSQKELGLIHEDVNQLIKVLNQSHIDHISNLESSITKIKNSCDSAIGSFNKEIESLSDGFKSKMNETTETFIGENKKLTEQIKHLQQLQDSLQKATKDVAELKQKVETISTELTSSQKSQDNTLTSILNTAESIPSTINTRITTQTNAINDHFSTLGKTLESVNSTVSSLTQECSSIKKDISELKKTMENQYSSNIKEIRQTRTLFIIGLAFITILSIALKFIG